MAFQRIAMKLIDRVTGVALANYSVSTFIGHTCFEVALPIYSDAQGQVVLSPNGVTQTDAEGNFDFWAQDLHVIDLLISNPAGQRVSHVVVKGNSVVDVQSASHLSDIEINAVRQTLSQGPGTGGSVVSVNGRQGVVILTKADVSLDAVDNTSDADKPLSAVAASALATLATQVADKLPASALSPFGLQFGASADVVAARENLSLQSAALARIEDFAPTGHTHVIADVIGLTTSLADTAAQLTALATGLEAAQLLIASASEQGNTHSGLIATLNTQVGTALSGVSAAQSAIAILQTNVGALQSADVTQQSALASTQATVTTLQGQVNALVTSVSSLNSSVADLIAAAPKVDIVEKLASHTLVLADAGKQIDMNVASANTLTVPLDSAVNFPIGTRISVCQAGAGVTTIAGTSGVVFKKPATVGFNLSEREEIAMLHKTAANTWRLNGALNVL